MDSPGASVSAIRSAFPWRFSHPHGPLLAQSSAGREPIAEVLPSSGLVHSERGPLMEVLCKPKIMALKSVTLERIEQLEAVARATAAGGTGRGIATAVASASKRQSTATGAGR